MRTLPALRIMSRGLSRFGNKPIVGDRPGSAGIAIFSRHSTPFTDNTIILDIAWSRIVVDMIAWRVLQ